MRTRKIIATIAVLITGVLATTFGGPSPARASSSYLYNQRGSTVLVTCSSGCGGVGTAYYARNGTPVTMFCYGDYGTFTGNYTSGRWFEIFVSGKPGLWFVHSSYVYYQTTVPHC